MRLFRRWWRNVAEPDKRKVSTPSALGRGIEPLEDRLVLAIDPAAGTLRVVNDNFADETFSTAGIDNTGRTVVAFERVGAGPALDGIWFQLYDPQGNPALDANLNPLPNIQVTNNGQSASVAMYDSRIISGAEVPGFAITWAANEVDDPTDPVDDGSDVIYVQRYNQFGEVDGDRIALARSTNPNLSFEQPTLDSTEDGSLVVVWREINPQVATGDIIRFAIISSNNALGIGTVATNVDTGGLLIDPPAVAVNNDGNFVVAWIDVEQTGANNAFVQRFSGVGAAAGPPILVNSNALSVDVDITENRSFVVAWENAGTDPANAILHQRYDSNGNPLASANPVMPSSLVGAQPNVVVDPIQGTYTIGASTNSLGGGDFDIFLVQFEADGTRVNQIPFQVAPDLGDELFTDPTGVVPLRATKSQMAINDSGDFVVTWWGNVPFDSVGVGARNFLGDRTVTITGGEVDETDTGVNTTITFTVTLSSAAPVDLLVTFQTEQLAANDPRLGRFEPAIAGTDYIPIVGPPPITGANSVTIQAGETTATFTVTVIGDDQIEADEAFGVQLVANTAQPSVTPSDDPDESFALGVIIDNDTPRVSISDGVPFPAVEGTDAFVTFTVTLTKTPNEGDLVLSFRTVDGTATAGQDYVATSGTLTFQQSTTTLSQVIVVPILDDLISEPVPPQRTIDPNFVETFSVVVTTAPANDNPARIIRGAGIGAVKDNEPAQIIAPPGNLFTVVEGDLLNGQSLTFLLNKPATVATNVTVQTMDGNPPNAAIAGVDYVPIFPPPPATTANTISIAAGDTQFSVGVGILGNEIPERDRTFFIQLTVDPAELFLPGGTGVTTATFAVQILDDDGIAVFMIDVSDSMDSVRAQDVVIDGQINKFDDVNGDGEQGTLIDQAVQQTLLAFTNSVQRRGAIIIFAKQAAVMDFSSAPGVQSFVTKGEDGNLNGQDEFSEVLRTIRIGQGGLYSEAKLDPTKTYYEYALLSLLDMGVPTDFIANATILTDGSGLLANNSPALAAVVAAGIPVSSILLGPYSLVGPTQDIDTIVAATGGAIGTVNDQIIPLSLPAPLTILQSPSITPVLPGDLEGAIVLTPTQPTDTQTDLPAVDPVEDETTEPSAVEPDAPEVATDSPDETTTSPPTTTDPPLADQNVTDELDPDVAQDVVLTALEEIV